MADINLIPIEPPELPDDPNQGDINIAGIGSFGGLIVSGVSTLGVTSATNLTSQTLNVSGVSTLGVTTISQLYVSGISTLGITTIQTLNVSGTSTLGVTSISQLYVSGITTLGVTTSTNLTTQTLSVSGVSTLGVLTTTNINAQTLSVSGISTLGVTTITNLTSQTLSVSGISSFVNGPLLVTNGSIGIATTNPTSKLHIVGNTLINGITTTSNLTVNSIKYGGSTSTYSGVVGITTVNSDDEQIHFITFNTSTSEVHVSNFVSGRRFTIIVRNTAGGARNVTIRTSTTTTGHAVVPILVSQSTDTVTDGNVSMGDFNGVKIEIFNINGTVFGHYG